MATFPNNSEEKEILIGFIEESEVQDFSTNIKYKEKVVIASVVVSALVIAGVFVYAVPTFISSEHKEQMTYRASISEHAEEEKEKTEILHATYGEE